MSSFDTIFTNGNIITMDPQKEYVDTIVVSGEKIFFAGSYSDVKSFITPSSQIIDLEGRTVLPGFIDCHMHFMVYQLRKSIYVNLEEAQSIQNIIDSVSIHIKENKYPELEWIFGGGWNQQRFAGYAYPYKYDLDKINTDKPIVLYRSCQHACVANSKALEVSGITSLTPDPPGGRIDRDEKGNPTGLLFESAKDLIKADLYSSLGKKGLKKLLAEGGINLGKLGITTVHTDELRPDVDKKQIIDAFKEMAEEGALPIRTVMQLRASKAEDVEFYSNIGITPWGSFKRLRFGPVKIILDGALGARTAALLEPYSDQPDNYGILLVSPDDFDKTVHTAFKFGFDVIVHAIGDRAILLAAQTFEKYESMYKSKGLIPSINHCQICSKTMLSKLKQLGVVVNIQPVFINSDMHFANDRLGEERIKYSYNWRTIMDESIKTVGSSDAPIEKPNPFFGIYCAVTRKDLSEKPEGGWYRDQALSVGEAIDLFTSSAASYSREQDIKGSLSKGKFADFVVLSHNPFKAQEDALKDITILKTCVGGAFI